MLFTLVRHGEVDGRPFVFRGRSDPALSARGLHQLRAAASAFDAPRINRLVSSPSRRCKDFCASWAPSRNVALRIVDALREIDFGQWEEHSPAEALAHDPVSYQALQAEPESWCSPNGEPYRAFRHRVLDAMRELRDSGDEHVGIVTHAGVIRVVLSETLNITASDAQRVAITPGGVCRIWYDAGDHHRLLALDNGTASWPAG